MPMKRAIPDEASFSVEDEDDEPPKTMAEAVYRRFRQDILWGRLPPDSPLRSDQLRTTYDVGISPLREALSRLASERLVTSQGQRGFRVAPLTAGDVLDLMEARIVVECEALTRSIQSGDLDWETAVVSSFHALSRVAPPTGPGEQAEKWAKYHRKFHMALLAGCNSRWMRSIARSLFDHAERHRIVTIHGLSDRRNAGDEHKQIMEAALSGNVKAAVAALDHHYRATANLAARSLAENDHGETTES